MAVKADSDATSVNLLDLPLEDAVRHKLEGAKELNIAMVGRYQVGKSTLINAMFKNAVKASTAIAKAPCTQSAKGYTIIVQGTNVKVTIYDSRGLQDGQGEDKTYLADIARACPNIHLLIYCTKLGEPIRPEEEIALKNLTSHFKDKLKNIVIALTFSNQVEPPDPDTEEIAYFKDEVESKKQALNNCFRKLKIQDHFVGFNSRTFPVGSARRPKLPTGKLWLPELWKGCLDVCDVEAKPAVLISAWPFLLLFGISATAILAYYRPQSVNAFVKKILKEITDRKFEEVFKNIKETCKKN